MTKTDNPRELRAIAERIEMECDTIIRHGLDAMPAEDQADTIALINDRLALAGHILATVRDDDGEAVTEEWLRGLPHVQGKFPDDVIFGPLVRGIIRNGQSPSNGRWHWCVRTYPIPEGSEPTTRGQFRALCRGLGIEVQ